MNKAPVKHFVCVCLQLLLSIKMVVSRQLTLKNSMTLGHNSFSFIFIQILFALQLLVE